LPERVILKATPRKRSSFARWRRACSGKGRCAVAMTKDRNVLAKFRGPLRTRVKLTAADTTVPNGGRASLRVKAKPCRGRRHDRVKLYRTGKRVAGKRLNRNCAARFHPRIEARARFRAKVRADLRHRAGKSAPVAVGPSR
jgi:hypothetical protein